MRRSGFVPANNGFGGWLALPKEVLPIIAQFVASGDKGISDLIAFGLVCKKFRLAYKPILIDKTTMEMKRQIESRPGEALVESSATDKLPLSRFFSMCYFVSNAFKKEEAYFIPMAHRLSILEAIKSQLQSMVLLENNSNNNLRQILQANLLWPVKKSQASETEKNQALQFYKQYLAFSISGKETKLDYQESDYESLTADLSTVLSEFIGAINCLIEDHHNIYHDSIPYDAALRTVDYFIASNQYARGEISSEFNLSAYIAIDQQVKKGKCHCCGRLVEYSKPKLRHNSAALLHGFGLLSLFFGVVFFWMSRAGQEDWNSAKTIFGLASGSLGLIWAVVFSVLIIRRYCGKSLTTDDRTPLILKAKTSDVADEQDKVEKGFGLN